jgi:hypothetical protein
MDKVPPSDGRRSMLLKNRYGVIVSEGLVILDCQI